MADAYLIKCFGKPEHIQLDGTLKQLQDLVGGYIQYYPLRRPGIHLIMNEEGKIEGLPRNIPANVAFMPQNDYFAGNVIVVRMDGESEGNLKQADIMWIKERLGGFAD